MKKSIARAASAAVNADAKVRAKVAKATNPANPKRTDDSFVNWAANFGIGTDNLSSGGTYGFNPVTRNRSMLEWVYRGSWLGGVAIDIPAEDMTRAGVELKGELEPDQIEEIEETVVTLGIWNAISDTIKWSRLYGGAIAVMLIDGQDPSTPLRLNTIRKNQFCGLTVLDRWMIQPSLSDLVTDYGPSLGLPKYYQVVSNAPALSRQTIHYSRCLRLEGIRLPYWQRLTENLWSISILERIYDRMIAFDSATTGAAQLVYKAYLRTYKVKDLREISAAGGPGYQGLIKYVNMMRQFQSVEGITLLDSDDELEAATHAGFSGLADALKEFGQQLAGALQIPLTRLFGQSPSGFSSGDSDIRQYYDGIAAQQMAQLYTPMTRVYRATAQSLGIALPDGFKIKFNSLWQMSETDKATIAGQVTTAVTSAEGAGIINKSTALKELRQSAATTGVFSNITDEDIDEAEQEELLQPPPGAIDPATGLPVQPQIDPATGSQIDPATGLPVDPQTAALAAPAAGGNPGADL